MTKVLKAIFFTYLLSLSWITVAQKSSTGNPTLDQLRSYFEKGLMFQAQLNHMFIDAYTKDTTRTFGEIWIDKNRYKIQLKSGTIFVDGKNSYVYNKEKNQVVISTYNPEEDDYAPSRILYGSLTSYSIKTSSSKNNKTTIVLTSDDPFALFSRVDIDLNSKAIPTKINVLDQGENRIISTFTSGKFVAINGSAFSINYPKSAELIDLRKNK